MSKDLKGKRPETVLTHSGRDPLSYFGAVNTPVFRASTILAPSYADRKRDKGLSWLQRAVTLDPDNGDAWGALYKLQSEHGAPADAAKVVADCVAAEPRHGEVWQRVAKATFPPRSIPDILVDVAAEFSV